MYFVLFVLKMHLNAEDMFAVVEFKEKAEVEVVPLNWISKDGKFCSWPSITGAGAAQKISKAVQNKVEPNDNWESFTVKRVMCKTGI